MQDLMSDIRGAMYFPARAYNAYQTWNEYDHEIAVRDMGYAQRLNLNAVRFFLSYEYWLKEPEEQGTRFDDFLDVCQSKGIKALPAFFEGCGVEPSEEMFYSKDCFTAFAIFSPGTVVVNDQSAWKKTAEFVTWFMEQFGSDDRLVAIEVMNEPKFNVPELKFARAMLKVADALRGTIPLSIGSLGSTVLHNAFFMDVGLDVLQCHLNFPRSAEQFETLLKDMQQAQQVFEKPIWITEWQRIRPIGNGWENNQFGPDEWQPALATLAPLIHQYNPGNFFWSLMLKPAYLPPQRAKGTLNGIFHEDGAVWSLEDARAIANDAAFQAEERRQWPEWAKEIPQKFGLA